MLILDKIQGKETVFVSLFMEISYNRKDDHERNKKNINSFTKDFNDLIICFFAILMFTDLCNQQLENKNAHIFISAWLKVFFSLSLYSYTDHLSNQK